MKRIGLKPLLGVLAPGWFMSLFAGAMLCAATGCGKPDVAGGPAASGGGTAGTPANGMVSQHEFKVSQGMDLAAVKNQSMLHPQFELTPDDVDTEVIFGVVENEEKHSSMPVVVKRSANGWKVIEAAELPGQEWVYAAAVPAREEVWGILDVSGEPAAGSGTGQLTLLRSKDGGETWQYFAGVKKLNAAAEYAGFSLSKSGEGRLSMHLEDDTDGVQHGYYHYKTIDGGKTWTGPTPEPDDVVEADSLKHFDTVEEAIKGTQEQGGGSAECPSHEALAD